MTLEKPLNLDIELRKYFQENSDYAVAECYSCGTCTAICPQNEVKEQKLTVRRLLHQAQIGVEPDEVVWNCTSCAQCETTCPRGVNIVDSFHVIRQFGLLTNKVPAAQKQILWNVLEEANPMGESKSLRGQWARGLDLHDAQGRNTLFYVGGPASYDPRLQNIAKTVAQLMGKYNIDFGIMGKEEPTSGEAVREAGDFAFLDHIVARNVEQFNKLEVEQIVVLSPHAYDVMKNIYPEYGLEAEVVHYTELLNNLWNDGTIKFQNKIEQEMTYHDPCYLGRYNGIYDAPRNLIEDIQGVNFTEMRDHKSNALCCGGGGNAVHTDDTPPDQRISGVRIKQALDANAQNVITACGYCTQMLEDASKTTGANLPITDVAEIVARAIGLGGK